MTLLTLQPAQLLAWLEGASAPVASAAAVVGTSTNSGGGVVVDVRLTLSPAASPAAVQAWTASLAAGTLPPAALGGGKVVPRLVAGTLVQATAPAAPPAPRLLSVAYAAGAATVALAAAPGGGDAPAQYHVAAVPLGDAAAAPLLASGPGPTLRLPGVVPGVPYALYASASNAAGAAGVSGGHLLETAPRPARPPPADVAAALSPPSIAGVAQDGGRVLVTLKPRVAASGAVTGYLITATRRSGTAAGGASVLGATSGTVVVLEGLLPASVYELTASTVVAGGGAGPPSPVFYFATQ